VVEAKKPIEAVLKEVVVIAGPHRSNLSVRQFPRLGRGRSAIAHQKKAGFRRQAQRAHGAGGSNIGEAPAQQLGGLDKLVEGYAGA
jgi:hypothetical protein